MVVLYVIWVDLGILVCGIVVVCDFGGSGIGIMFVDVVDEYWLVVVMVCY